MSKLSQRFINKCFKRLKVEISKNEKSIQILQEIGTPEYYLIKAIELLHQERRSNDMIHVYLIMILMILYMKKHEIN